jgi:3-phosphoshikimate 1-carboxyvinyltransferase
MFSLLSDRPSLIRGYPRGQDNITTLSVIEDLGITLQPEAEDILYLVPSPGDTQGPQRDLDCMNSGTTARLMSGLIAGLGVPARLTGDESLTKRPMERIARPLRQLGADIRVSGKLGTLPLEIHPTPLKGAPVHLDVASAQVKSAVLLAGLFAEGTTRVQEPYQSRDHTERLLKHMGAELSFDACFAEVKGLTGPLTPLDLSVPGDPSSAAYWVVLAACIEGSDLIIEDLLLNPTRTGFLKILRRMGADIEVLDRRPQNGESVGHIRVRGQGLTGTRIRASEVPATIDELPILAVAMACAEGESSLHGAEELRVKESDRIQGTVDGLRRFGVAIEETFDGFILEGGPMTGASPRVYGDHRLIMAFSIAAALAQGNSMIRDAEFCGISYPEFCEDLALLGVSCTTSG